MNKLIKLLNEYEKWKSEKCSRGNYVWGIDKDMGCIFASRFPDGAYICEDECRAIIICKGYNFIKWLVDKDKIDYEKCIKEFMLKDFRKFYYLSKADNVIANLSIQYDPIEFLIDILK